MVTINVDELLKKIKENQPVNCTELTKLLGFECSSENVNKVYNKVSRLALDGIVKTKRVGGSRVIWIDERIGK
jgi:predicted transcriptional regulator